MEKLKKALKATRLVIEEIWQVLVIVWNLPIGIIELVWTLCFNRDKFNYNWGLLKDAIRGKRYDK